jgi:hypothetical protein
VKHSFSSVKSIIPCPHCVQIVLILGFRQVGQVDRSGRWVQTTHFLSLMEDQVILIVFLFS